jgi:hypothetical protein
MSQVKKVLHVKEGVIQAVTLSNEQITRVFGELVEVELDAYGQVGQPYPENGKVADDVTNKELIHDTGGKKPEPEKTEAEAAPAKKKKAE